MCCLTHDERDRDDDMRGVEYTRADSRHLQCQCKFGNSCAREQSQSDLLCDWCRGRDHQEACGELMSVSARRASKMIADYVIDDEAWPATNRYAEPSWKPIEP
jgi:hypothetical protein